MTDILIDVRFRTTSEGGRNTPIVGEKYSCPLIVDGLAFDCRIDIKVITIELWHRYILPVRFLFRKDAMDNIRVGSNIKLWEGKDIADGVVKEIVSN